MKYDHTVIKDGIVYRAGQEVPEIQPTVKVAGEDKDRKGRRPKERE